MKEKFNSMNHFWICVFNNNKKKEEKKEIKLTHKNIIKSLFEN